MEVPIALMLRHTLSKSLHDCAVEPLEMHISLGMIGGRRTFLDSFKRAQRRKESSYKLWSVIGQQIRLNSVQHDLSELLPSVLNISQ